MFENLAIIRMSEALAEHASARLGLVARNIAGADTPGFKAMDLPDFASTYDDGGMAMRATRPGHVASMSGGLEPVALRSQGEMSPDGNTVSLEREMVRSVEIRQQHDMALAVYRSAADIIRASLGRR